MMERPIIQVENILTSIDLNKKFDRDYLVKYTNGEIIPNLFAVRYHVLDTVVNVYENGSIVALGSKSEDIAWDAISRIANQELKVSPARKDMVVLRVVASANIGKKVDPEGLIEKIPEYKDMSMVEDEYLVVKDQDFFLRIYASGRIICGALTLPKIIKMVTKIFELAQ